MSGQKKDGGKERWDLLPHDALREVARVMSSVLVENGGKYEPRNWEKGIAASRLYAAAMQHLTSWWTGEDLDPETGLHHLAHAACCVLFMLALARRSHKHDDRPMSERLP